MVKLPVGRQFKNNGKKKFPSAIIGTTCRTVPSVWLLSFVASAEKIFAMKDC